jgi:hypothetical protein
MISPEDLKEDIARNLEHKKGGRNLKSDINEDRDLLYRIDLKLSLEDIKPRVCPTTKLKEMQNRNFSEAYPYIEPFSWEIERKDLKHLVY